MSAGQEVGPLDREGRSLIQPPLPPDEATRALAAAAGVSTVGLRPSFVTPAAAHSHPDCRAILILIVAPHDDAVWDHSTFSKNRDRLLEGDSPPSSSALRSSTSAKRLLSTDHFSVDGTLVEAWASMKSFRPKDGSGEPPAGDGRNREADFHGQKRSNETHASTTDPEARLYRKGPGKEAKLCFMGHALMENRNGLVVDACLTEANGHAERIAALHMIEPRADRPRPITLGADRGYDAEDFVNELRSMKATPHVAQNTSGRSSAVDGRTTRHAGYAVSQRIRKRIEEAFGWIKTVAGQERTKFRGRERVGWAFTFAAAAYNLARLPKLLEAPA